MRFHFHFHHHVTTDGKVVDVEHEAETELEQEGNCAHSPLVRPSQDNSDLAAEQCGLGESGHSEGRLLGSFGGQAQWAPLLQLHFPDLLDDYLDNVLVETGQRLFKKEPMDAPSYADFAARRRELLKNRLEARKDIREDRLQGGRLGKFGGASAEGPSS